MLRRNLCRPYRPRRSHTFPSNFLNILRLVSVAPRTVGTALIKLLAWQAFQIRRPDRGNREGGAMGAHPKISFACVVFCTTWVHDARSRGSIPNAFGTMRTQRPATCFTCDLR